MTLIPAKIRITWTRSTIDEWMNEWMNHQLSIIMTWHDICHDRWSVERKKRNETHDGINQSINHLCLGRIKSRIEQNENQKAYVQNEKTNERTTSLLWILTWHDTAVENTNEPPPGRETGHCRRPFLWEAWPRRRRRKVSQRNATQRLHQARKIHHCRAASEYRKFSGAM